MNHCAKRSRQTAISDFFPRRKGVTAEMASMESSDGSVGKDEEMETEEAMDSKLQMRELLASAAEKRITIKSKSTEPVSGSSGELHKSSDELLGSSGELLENSGELFKSSGELLENSSELLQNTGEDDEQADSDGTSILSNIDDELFNSSILDDCLSATPAASTEKHDVALNRWPECSITLPPLKDSDKHTVMFRPHLMEGCAPRPFPDEYTDKWDSNHVRMPCSPLSQYPVESLNGEKVIKSRWEIINQALRSPIESSVDLENAILRYNSQHLGRWDFRGLHAFINKHLDRDQRCIFFEFTLPGMIDLALQLPLICTKPIPLLKKNVDHSITFSQKQIGCLLANAFLCTYPRRNQRRKYHNAQKWNAEYANYPDINFNRLFSGTKTGITPRNCEKLKCLLNYFTRIVNKEPTGTVTFHRQYLAFFPNWYASVKTIKEAVVLCNGLIEDEHGMLQVDFANRFVGGGVLGGGCVQEEIRFVVSPELILSRLFTECLGDSEALIVTGAEQYSKYKGYCDTFQFDGDFQDETERDSWGRRYIQVVAIDAHHFRKSEDQYWPSLIRRELNKAFVGFFESDIFPENLPAVATGNWGCGVYNGSPYLKFIIQLMAASQADRDMLYFSFGNKELQAELKQMHEFIVAKKLNVGNLWTLLVTYRNRIMSIPEDLRLELFDYIYKCYSECGENSTEQVNLNSSTVSSASKST